MTGESFYGILETICPTAEFSFTEVCAMKKQGGKFPLRKLLSKERRREKYGGKSTGIISKVSGNDFVLGVRRFDDAGQYLQLFCADRCGGNSIFGEHRHCMGVVGIVCLFYQSGLGVSKHSLRHKGNFAGNWLLFRMQVAVWCNRYGDYVFVRFGTGFAR